MFGQHSPSSAFNSMSQFGAPSHMERDLAADSTQRDENAEPKGVRRSFSWGKKKKRDKKAAADKFAKAKADAAAAPGKTEVLTVTLARWQADSELGLDLHAVTGDVIACYVGSIPEISVGDCILAIEGLELLYPGGPEKLDAARAVLRDPSEGEEDEHGPVQTVELTIEKNSMRTEVLRRHAALRGTSLDKLGLTLTYEDNAVTISEMDPKGLAYKSARIAIGDRLVGINGAAVTDLDGAVTLLQGNADELEVELELLYGFLAPEQHEYDAVLGVFVPTKKPVSGLARVKRSLSFGKKKRPEKDTITPRSAESAQSTPRGSSSAPAPASDIPAGHPGSDEEVPQLSSEPRLLLIEKNAEGKIEVTFRPHEITGELIVSQVGAGGAAHLAGAEVGDRVLALQGSIFEVGGDEDLEHARTVLQHSASSPTVEMIVQTRVRVERLEFGQEFVGGPKNKLGMTFYSFPDDQAVRITKLAGSAAKSGRFALGDRIVSVNGIRVNHAQTLSDHIAELGKRAEYVDFEVALGYAAEEGLWDGQGKCDAEAAGEKRKAKRSFSFGRRPKF